MEISEVNKVIAEFMGWYKQGTDLYPNAWNDNHGFRKVETDKDWEGLFCKSLDTLIPVWEKLGPKLKASIYISWLKKGSTGYSDGVQVGIEYESCKSTIQEAAARATAKVILELKKE